MRPPAIIADDLTGALDTAAQFTGRWGPVSVGFDLAALPQSAPLALSAGTRELDRNSAVARSIDFVEKLPVGPRFKKIDSLLRGNWAAELAAMRRAEPDRACIVAPAFPAQGRITREGRLIAPGHPIIDIAEMLVSEGLDPDKGNAVRIADAESDADLEALVATEAPREPLWCGAAGLARAIAGVEPIHPVMPAGRSLVIIGSDHPVAIAQRRAIAAARPEAMITFRLGDDPAWPFGSDLLVLAFDAQRGADRAEVAGWIFMMLAQYLPALPTPDRLIVTGGETLHAVLCALGAARLLCLGEIAPGLPVSRMEDGLWRGSTIVSKSGAFGHEDTMLTLCRA